MFSSVPIIATNTMQEQLIQETKKVDTKPLKTKEETKQTTDENKINTFEETIKEKTKEQTTDYGDTKEPTEDRAQDKSQKVLAKKASVINHTQGESAETSKIAIEQKLLQLLEEVLGIPLETIQETLAVMGIEVNQLLNQETFSSFVNELLGGDAMQLLVNEGLSEQIKTLWEGIESLKSELTNKYMDKDVTQSLERIPAEKTAELTLEVVLNTVKDPNQTTIEERLLAGDKVVGTRTTKVTQVTTEALTAAQGETQTLASQLPVQNMLETQLTRLWQQEGTEKAVGSQKSMSLTQKIIEKIDTITLKEGKEITIELSPKELGKLSLKIAENNGIVTTTIRVENERTKELVMEQLERLRENLEAQGLTVGSLEVEVRQNSHQEAMYKERQKSSKRIQELIDKHMQTLEEVISEEIADPTMTSEIDIEA